MIVMILIIMMFRLLTSVEGVRGHESAGGAVVEEELVEAQRRALHKEHKEHKEHMTMMLYFLRKCSQIANGQYRDDHLVGQLTTCTRCPVSPVSEASLIITSGSPSCTTGP